MSLSLSASTWFLLSSFQGKSQSSQEIKEENVLGVAEHEDEERILPPYLAVLAIELSGEEGKAFTSTASPLALPPQGFLSTTVPFLGLQCGLQNMTSNVLERAFPISGPLYPHL